MCSIVTLIIVDARTIVATAGFAFFPRTNMKWQNKNAAALEAAVTIVAAAISNAIVAITTGRGRGPCHPLENYHVWSSFLSKLVPWG